MLLLPDGEPQQTDLTGHYQFEGLDPTQWTIEPQLENQDPNDISGILDDDAALVLQRAAGYAVLSSKVADFAADVTGNGKVSALDAALILQRISGDLPTFPVARRCASDWVFVPEPKIVDGQTRTDPTLGPESCQLGRITLASVHSEISGQDFAGAKFGDVNGDWGQRSLQRAMASDMPRFRVGHGRRSGNRVRIPIVITGEAQFHSLTVRLQYNRQRFHFERIRTVGGARRALSSNHESNGVITLALASAQSMAPGETIIVELTARTPRAAIDLKVVAGHIGE